MVRSRLYGRRKGRVWIDMTESEAIKELQDNIDLPFGVTVSDEASRMAINALEKQKKIKEAFEMWKAETGGYYCADDETISFIRILKKILRSDEE